MTATNHNYGLHQSKHKLKPKKQRLRPLTKTALCYHHHLIYDAKNLKAPSLDDENPSITGAIGPQYYVHYGGWKEKWNEWVPGERLLKKTTENLRQQASLKAAYPHLLGRGPGQAGSGQVES